MTKSYDKTNITARPPVCSHLSTCVPVDSRVFPFVPVPPARSRVVVIDAVVVRIMLVLFRPPARWLPFVPFVKINFRPHYMYKCSLSPISLLLYIYKE